jgi:DUF1365 family protein
MTRSALYVGHLLHVRGGGEPHHFRYRVSFAAIDVDELPDLASRLTLLSHNQPNVYSLHDADYAGAAERGMRGSIHRFAEQRGVAAPLGQIVLLTQLRAFGWVFNPVSFFLCYPTAVPSGSRAEPVCVVAEVNNTYGHSHRYLLDARNRVHGGGLRYRTAKELYVSPFLADDHSYEWELASAGTAQPAARHDVRMRLSRHGRETFMARLVGDRRELSDRSLFKLLWSHPLMPQRILAGIHWQALKLRVKGLQYRPPPRGAV